MTATKKSGAKNTRGRWLDVDEIRVVADLRIMHSKVDDLYQIVANLKRRHSESDIVAYADQPVLNEDISARGRYLFVVCAPERRAQRQDRLNPLTAPSSPSSACVPARVSAPTSDTAAD